MADDAGVGLDLDEHDRPVDRLVDPGALIGTGGLSACAVTRLIFMKSRFHCRQCLSHAGHLRSSWHRSLRHLVITRWLLR